MASSAVCAPRVGYIQRQGESESEDDSAESVLEPCPTQVPLAAARMGGAELARRLRDSLRVKVRMGWAESTECLDKLRAGSDLRVISLCALCVGMCMRSSARRLLLVQRGMKLAALTPCWPRKQNSEHGQELARELAR